MSAWATAHTQVFSLFVKKKNKKQNKRALSIYFIFCVRDMGWKRRRVRRVVVVVIRGVITSAGQREKLEKEKSPLSF